MPWPVGQLDGGESKASLLAVPEDALCPESRNSPGCDRSSGLRAVDEKGEVITVTHGERIVEIKRETEFRRLLLGEDNERGPEPVLQNEVVVPAAPAGSRHEVLDQAGRVPVADFVQVLHPEAERLRVEVEERPGPLFSHR